MSEAAETGGPPVPEAAAGPQAGRAPPDSATFVTRAMSRGMTEEAAVQRYTQMKSSLAEGRGVGDESRQADRGEGSGARGGSR